MSAPVSPASATTPVDVEAYITPSTTMGVCWVPTPWKVHAGTSVDTLDVLICVSIEYLVPARSPAYRGQSASVKARTSLVCWANVCVPTAAATRTAQES
jgi:hypothetical protein